MRLGIGLSSYVEVTAPTGQEEHATVEVHPDGSATVSVGTFSHGQGHETAFTMIVADRLGIAMDQHRLRAGLTPQRVARGGGTGGSRSAQLGGSAVHAASVEVLDVARQRAAELLEASADDIVVTDEGRLGVAGVPSCFGELGRGGRPLSDEPLRAELDHTTDGPQPSPRSAPTSAWWRWTRTPGHGQPVALRGGGRCRQTCSIRLIVAGQQHGGVASGIGQALYEYVAYDDDGNPLTTGLADYAMPSAAEFCDFTVDSTITPTHLNPLGREGHRRGRHHRRHPRSPERGHRRAQRPRNPPHRSAAHPGPRLAGHPVGRRSACRYSVAFTMSADPEQIIADIINPETRGNLYPHYHALREAAPIHKTHNPILHEAWVFTRHADADQLLRNPKAISDRRTTEMYNVGAGGTEYYDMMKRMLLWLDPPDHQRIRSMVARVFTPRAVEKIKPAINDAVTGLLDAVADDGGMDVVSQFAYPLPVHVICEMLGIPRSDIPDIEQWMWDFARRG